MDRQYAGCQIHMPSGKQAHNKLRKQEDLRDTCKASYTFLLPRGLASNCDTELEVTQASQVQPQESSEPEAEIRIFPGAGMALPVILSPGTASLRQCCSVFILLSASS